MNINLDDLLTLDEAAKVSGLPRWTLKYHVDTDRLPYVLRFKKVLIARADLRVFMAKHASGTLRKKRELATK